MQHHQCRRACTAMLVAGACFPAFAQTTRLADDAQWHVSLGGFSQHARETLAPGRQWQEVHPGIGLQRRLNRMPWTTVGVDSNWKSRVLFGTMEDSRGFLGSYGGISIMREIAHVGTLRLEAGLSAVTYYRSSSWSGDMHFVPAILPTLSLVGYRTGLGLDLSWAPPVTAQNTGSVSTLLLQFTYRP